jgi:hypothetical protein
VCVNTTPGVPTSRTTCVFSPTIYRFSTTISITMEECAGFKGTWSNSSYIHYHTNVCKIRALNLYLVLIIHILIYFLIAVLPTKVNEKSTAIRHLFLKMHVTREKCPQKPEYQTLFVVGVPEFCNQVNLHFKLC